MNGHESNEVAYVVSIPQSDTVHQVVPSKRYYKRFNFESVPMEDYEIRDVLNRASHPEVESRVGHIEYEEGEAVGKIFSIPIFAKNNRLWSPKTPPSRLNFGCQTWHSFGSRPLPDKNSTKTIAA